MNRIITVSLPVLGLNTVFIPENGEVLSVVVGPGMDPALAVYGDEGEPREERHYYVARQQFDDGVEVGDYVGFAQAPEKSALHVFEYELPKTKEKKAKAD